jgi:nucleoside diphosphate kinase
VPADVPPHIVLESAAKLFYGAFLSTPFTRTFAIIKPDAVNMGNVPAILDAISSSPNLSLVNSKLVYMDVKAVSAFYAEHTGKSFFPELRQFMTSGPALVMVLEGPDAVTDWRKMIGPTNSNTAMTVSSCCGNLLVAVVKVEMQLIIIVSYYIFSFFSF